MNVFEVIIQTLNAIAHTIQVIWDIVTRYASGASELLNVIEDNYQNVLGYPLIMQNYEFTIATGIIAIIMLLWIIGKDN